ncbi:hypothetical protein MRB53_009685 [Persea americana]|uniref:Uncharacterized protein n=1 Tax=Persea americana TaxID=3435 RepID=A0ACC2LQF0_PERAE|nr:hypothetical protein MRB53_009685 [Persea americana]
MGLFASHVDDSGEDDPVQGVDERGKNCNGGALEVANQSSAGVESLDGVGIKGIEGISNEGDEQDKDDV